jgi:DNA-directed RNA polymerase specialized sigma24 family protein
VSQPTFDLAEARQAIESLTSTDLLRLRKAGRQYAFAAGCEADDLLNEAVCQTIEGVRNCPRGMEMVPFLIGVMRSRASARQQKVEPELVSADATDAEGRFLHEPVETKPNAEELALSREDASARRNALETLFADDEEATLFLWAYLDDLPKEEIMTMIGVDMTAYATIRRRVRRTIDAAFPNGWSS